MVLFGGERDSGPLDDLWVLRGWQQGATARWTQVKVKASPAPRFGHTLAVGMCAVWDVYGAAGVCALCWLWLSCV